MWHVGTGVLFSRSFLGCWQNWRTVQYCLFLFLHALPVSPRGMSMNDVRRGTLTMFKILVFDLRLVWRESVREKRKTIPNPLPSSVLWIYIYKKYSGFKNKACLSQFFFSSRSVYGGQCYSRTSLFLCRFSILKGVNKYEELFFERLDPLCTKFRKPLLSKFKNY